MVMTEKIPKEPGIDTVKGRHQMAMLRRVVMGEEVGLEGLAALAHAQWSGWMRHLSPSQRSRMMALSSSLQAGGQMGEADATPYEMLLLMSRSWIELKAEGSWL